MKPNDERLFLSFFEKLIEDNDSSKYINSIIEFLCKCSNDDLKNGISAEAEDKQVPKLNSKKKEIIKNRKYQFKLVKSDHDYLQYTLDRLIKGISSGTKNSRSGFGACLGRVLNKFKDSIDFDNLITLFLNVYSASNDFVLNKQIKYIYLGRLEVLIQLHDTGFFQNAKTEHIEKIVEYVWEAYNHKVYLQDASVIVLVLILSDLYNRNVEAYESIKNSIKFRDSNSPILSLIMFINKIDGNGLDLSNLNTAEENKDLDEDEVLLRGLEQMKNYYPILSVYVYFLIERAKRDELLFDKLINLLNFMLESNSFNSVKLGLITFLIAMFEAKDEHFLRMVFDRLNVFLKTISKYYRFANSTNIKHFINSYITLLSNAFNESSLLDHSNSFNPYLNVYNSFSKLDTNSEDLMVYLQVHNNLVNTFFKKFDKEVKVDSTAADNKPLLESELRYELLMKIGDNMNINSVNILNPVIKSILFSISRPATATSDNKREVKSLGETQPLNKNHQLCLKLLEELKDENKFKYVLYLLKLLLIDNFSNLTLLTNFINGQFKIEPSDNDPLNKMDVDGVEEVNREKEMFGLYYTLLVKYLGNLVNKFNKLAVNELKNYHTILLGQFNSFYPKKIDPKSTGDDVLNMKNKFLLLVKLKPGKNTKSASDDDKTQFMTQIVLIAVSLYLTLIINHRIPLDGSMLEYLSLLYKYFNSDSSVEENTQLYYLLIHYLFNSTTNIEVKDEQLSGLFELMNRLLWKLVLPELDSEFCKIILYTTLTGNLDELNALTNLNCDSDESTEDTASEDEDEVDDEEDTDNDDDANEDADATDASMDEAESPSESEDAEEELEENDIVLTDRDKIFDELTTKSSGGFDRKKIKDELAIKQERHKIKEIGYNMLLNLVESTNENMFKDVFTLNDLLELLNDYSKSTKFSYSNKIVNLIKELSNTKRIGNNRTGRNTTTNGTKTGTVTDGSDEDDDKIKTIVKIVNILLYNKNIKNVLVSVILIVDKIVADKQLVTIIINYLTFVLLTKRTKLSVNTVVELYKTFDCVLNLFKILQILNKNVMKSQLLSFSSKIIDLNRYYTKCKPFGSDLISKLGSDDFKQCVFNADLKEDLTTLLDHVSKFSLEGGVNDANNDPQESPPKRAKLEDGSKKDKTEFSTQYVRSLVVCINSLYHYVTNNRLSNKKTDDIFSKIRASVRSIQHKQLKKYFNNIAIK